MTYAIIKTGGKQIKLNAGDNIWIEKIQGEQGSSVTLTEVKAIFDGKELHIGKPNLKAEIVASVIKQGKGPKIRILRFKEKSNWERRQGHRQPYTKLFINEIKLDGKSIASAKNEVAVVKTSKDDNKLEGGK